MERKAAGGPEAPVGAGDSRLSVRTAEQGCQQKITDERGNIFLSEPHAVYFVRHGQPEWSSGGVGIDEPELTELGRKQAECVGRHLCRLPVTDFYVSNLLRARQTAAPLAGLLGREPVIADWYQEIQAKNLNQRPLSEVEEYFRCWYQMSLTERYAGPPEGESLQHAYRRISGGLDAVLQKAGFSFEADGRYRRWHLPREPRCVVLVGHTFASAIALCHLLDLEYTGASGEQFRMGWGAYNKAVPFPLAGGFVWRLQAFDVRGHLLQQGLSCDDLPLY